MLDTFLFIKPSLSARLGVFLHSFCYFLSKRERGSRESERKRREKINKKKRKRVLFTFFSPSFFPRLNPKFVFDFEGYHLREFVCVCCELRKFIVVLLYKTHLFLFLLSFFSPALEFDGVGDSLLFF